MRVLMVIASLMLASCQSVGPAVPPAPEVIRVPVTTYVPVPEKLTAPCPIARGDLEQVVIVARKRKASLEKCNGQLEQIRALQGTDTEATP